MSLLPSWLQIQPPEEPYCHACLKGGFLSAARAELPAVGAVTAFLCSDCSDSTSIDIPDLPAGTAPPKWQDPRINMNDMSRIGIDFLKKALAGVRSDALACALLQVQQPIKIVILAALPPDRNPLIQQYVQLAQGVPLRFSKAGQAHLKAAIVREALKLPHPPV